MLIPLPSRTELLRLFRLDEKTGELFWRARSDVRPSWNTKHAGKIAGSKNAKGYINVHVQDRIVCAHRVVFKIAFNSEPPVIDHINMIKSDNRPCNLRAATISENGANSRPKRKHLPKGVCARKSGRFAAFIAKNRKSNYLGTFDTAEEAHRAYCIAAHKIYREFARTT